MNNSDILDLLLEGAAVTKPGIGHLYNNDSKTGVLVSEVHTTCTYGAINYALALRHSCVYTTDHFRVIRVSEFYDALERLDSDYFKRFGTHLLKDNDTYGRDYVVAQVKELVNEQESSS
jgi:hypothetical protein